VKDRISQEIKAAMKAKDEARLSTLRLILTEFVRKEKEKGIPPTDEQCVQILQTMVRKCRDAAEQFTNGNRPELAAKELAEVTILESFLPAQLPEEQVRELALAAIAEVGAKTPKDMGRVMGLLTKKLAGQADGSVISRIVKEELQKLGS
jgi:uncharacterized protein YqeY